MSPKLRKMNFFAQKMVILFQNSDDEIQFSQEILTHSENQPHTLTQQIPIIFCCYYKPPRSWPHEVRNCCEAAVPEKN